MTVNHQPGPQSAQTRAQEQAFQHADVAEIARNVVDGNHVLLVRLANIAIIYPWPGVLATQPAIPSALKTHAQAIADAGLRVATEPDEDTKNRRRGAVVERVVWELVRKRDSSVLRERSIELTKNRWSGATWSKPKEIVRLSADECEVYECKLSPRALKKDDIDELADIRDTAAASGKTALVGVATLDTYTTFRQHASRLRTHGPLHYVTQAEVLSLRTLAPTKTFSY